MQEPDPVIVVEDDPDIRRLLAEILREEVDRVIECENGEDALAVLETVRPALITLDLAMPEMDGIQFVRKLRSMKLASGIPIIFVTAATEIVREELDRQGFATLAKPFRMEQLLDLVHRQMAQPSSG